MHPILYVRNPRDPKIVFYFHLFTGVLDPGRCLDGFVRHFSSRYTPSDPKFIILDPQDIKCLRCRVRIYRELGHPSTPHGSCHARPSMTSVCRSRRFSWPPRRWSRGTRCPPILPSAGIRCMAECIPMQTRNQLLGNMSNQP